MLTTNQTMIFGYWVRASGTLRATSRHWWRAVQESELCAIWARRELPLSARVPCQVPSVGAGPHAWLLLIGGPVGCTAIRSQSPFSQSRGATSWGDLIGGPGRIFPNSITRLVPGLSCRRCQPIRDETPVTSLLAQQHGLASQCDMNSPTSVLNFESKKMMRRRSVLFRQRLSAEGAKPESNNRWKSDLGHVCMYVCMYYVCMYVCMVFGIISRTKACSATNKVSKCRSPERALLRHNIIGVRLLTNAWGAVK